VGSVTTTLYKKTKAGKIQQWKIWVEDVGKSGSPEVWIEHGLTDGKKQVTHDIIKEGVNLGKANETTPVEQANLTAKRKATKQKEEGYKETIEEALKQQSISFTERFPKELCFYKPKNSIDDKKIAKLEGAGRLRITVKEDGMMYIVRKSEQFGVEIYSRRMELETDKFPHLVPSFEKMKDGTVLLGEMVLSGYDSHIKAFKDVTKICRSDTEKALERQKEFGNTHYRIFDVAFYNGECCLISHETDARHALAASIAISCDSSYIDIVERLDMTHAQAMQSVKNNKLEGLVLWDSKGKMKDGEAFTFNGKAYRPNILWKSKPKYEDDFIVRWDPDRGIGEYGKGKNKGKVGSVFVYQLDENGMEIALGKCGGGLTDKQRDFYSEKDMFPRVWRIEYDSIQPKTGSLRYPVFNADRTLSGDKLSEECLMSDTIKQARKQEKK